MRPLRALSVRPALPPDLSRLNELAHNLWWSWNQPAVDLFERIDRELWLQVGRNPVRLLGTVPQQRLGELAHDDGFRGQLERVLEQFDHYISNPRTWFARNVTETGEKFDGVGYFSFEFGIHECLPIYSGGMGLLAGDHIKSISDLGVPFAGMSLLYQEGYFRQYLNADGWQMERYLDNDFYSMPLQLERDANGEPLKIAVEYPGRQCIAQIWRINVGRVPLYVLDANLPENQPRDRDVTKRLYQGDLDMRIRQEILLGIGGVRALTLLGHNPSVVHMNEGHAAFSALERIRAFMKTRNMNFHEARELATAGSVFTTHTPVPAGIDVFAPALIDEYLGGYYAELGISRDEFLGLGRQNPFDGQEIFSMAVMAIRLADRVNGVSKLHGEVSRRMWHGVWPGVPEQEIPIGSITNGVHAGFWLAGSEVEPLYDRYLGPQWRDEAADASVWRGVIQIPAAELWRAHERGRERLVAYARERLGEQAENRGAPASEIASSSEMLNPEALTIGFARRFATYKRAMLMFHDVDRLVRIMGDKSRPVQFIIAGKAHPQDMPGREVIRQLIHRSRDPEFSSKIVFLEDYDIEVARNLVQGVDLWLTTPRRPLEASGTSGMKVALNAGLNVSILDGWWCEAYQPELGWAIGRGEEYIDEAYQDTVESRALYDLLEKEIVPQFYDRGPDGLPRSWIGRMKASVASNAPYFNTHRMVQEYVHTAYLPAQKRYVELTNNNEESARDLAAWKSKMREAWPDIRVVSVSSGGPSDVSVGTVLQVQAIVAMGKASASDLRVELYAGAIDVQGEIVPDQTIPMNYVENATASPGTATFTGQLILGTSGRRGFTVRVVPTHEDLAPVPEPGLIRWAT